MRDQTAALRPIGTTVTIVFSILSVGVLSILLAMIFGSGSLFGLGHNEICVEVRNGVANVPGTGGSVVSNTAPDVRSVLSEATLCDQNPVSSQRVLRVLNDLPTLVALLGALMLSMRMMRSASRDGVFTTRFAGQVRMLGWFVLVGETVATLIESLSRDWLTKTMITGPVPEMAWLGEWQFPLAAVFLGIVLISLGRVMHIGAEMRADLDDTV